jgi:hypothetical protein
VLLNIWPHCLQSTLGQKEQEDLYNASCLSSEKDPSFAYTLGLSFPPPSLRKSAADAVVSKISKGGGGGAEKEIEKDQQLLSALSRPDLLPILAKTRIFPALSKRIVQTLRQIDTSASSSEVHVPTVNVTDCTLCRSGLQSVESINISPSLSSLSSSSSSSSHPSPSSLLSLSLAHLTSHRLYMQAVHLLYSALQTHEYMREMSEGLSLLFDRLNAASKQSLSRLDAEDIAVYEKALTCMKEDGVGHPVVLKVGGRGAKYNSARLT